MGGPAGLDAEMGGIDVSGTDGESLNTTELPCAKSLPSSGYPPTTTALRSTAKRSHPHRRTSLGLGSRQVRLAIPLGA